MHRTKPQQPAPGLHSQMYKKIRTDRVVNERQEEKETVLNTNAVPKVSIIIVNRNGLKIGVLRDCITTIRDNTPIAHEIIVVDNASTDESVSWLRGQGITKIIVNLTNVGFAASNNMGVRIASGQYVLLLNNDIIINDSSWLVTMFNIIDKNSGIGIVGPSGGWLDPVSLKFTGYVDKRYLGVVQYLEGWCLLCRKADYMAIGGMDERFYYYAEDSDFSMRMKQHGKQVIQIPNRAITHLGMATSKNTKEFDVKSVSSHSTRLLVEKWQHQTKPDYTKATDVLIMRSGARGDILNTTPVLKRIKEINPNIKITYWCSSHFQDVMKNNPHIDRMRFVNRDDPSDRHYQIIINMDDYRHKDSMAKIDFMLKQYPRTCYRVYHPLMSIDIETRKRRGVEKKKYVDIFAEMAGVEVRDKRPVFVPGESDIHLNFPFNSNRKIVVVAFDAGWDSRIVPLKKANKIIGMLCHEYNVVAIGLDKGVKYDSNNNFIDMSGKTPTVDDVYAVINQADAFVGVDSMPLHFANMMNKPNVSLWSITEHSHVIGRCSDKAIQLIPSFVTCYPCYKEKCDFTDYERQYSCWHSIFAQDVFDSIQKLLGYKS